MQIQRWQSLFLFISAALMGAINFMPLATNGDGTTLVAVHMPVLLIVDVLIAVLLFVLIFMYNNLRQQMQVTTIAIVLMVAFGAIAGEIILGASAKVALFGALPAYVLALILAICARRLMRRDYNLLRSADRLR